MEGAGIYGASSGGLWNKGRLDMRDFGERAPQQPGFGGTYLAQGQNIPTERTDYTPPHDLGRTNAVDEQFGQTIGDYAHPGDTGPTPAGRWRPLWRESWVIEGRKQNQYEWGFLNPSGNAENQMLFVYGKRRAPPGQAYTVPLDRPHAVQIDSPKLW